MAVGRNLLGKSPEVVWEAKLVVRSEARGNCLINTEEEGVAEVEAEAEVW